MTTYTNSEINAIVATINEQLNASVERSIIWSWGISKRFATKYNNMPALGLRVSGLLHKGFVYIAYNEGKDLYEIFLTSIRGKEKVHIEEVYCDMLGNVIDSVVERSPKMTNEDYKRKALADSARKLA